MANLQIRKIDYIFFHEQEIWKRIQMYRLPRFCSGVSAIKKTGSYGNPTAMQAVKNLMEIPCVEMSDGRELKYPERCLRVIRATYASVKELTLKIARLKYLRIPFQAICARYGITEDLYQEHMQEFRMKAIERGCREKIFY